MFFWTLSLCLVFLSTCLVFVTKETHVKITVYRTTGRVGFPRKTQMSRHHISNTKAEVQSSMMLVSQVPCFVLIDWDFRIKTTIFCLKRLPTAVSIKFWPQTQNSQCEQPRQKQMSDFPGISQHKTISTKSSGTRKCDEAYFVPDTSPFVSNRDVFLATIHK